MKMLCGADTTKWWIFKSATGLWAVSPPRPYTQMGRMFNTGAEALAAFAQEQP